MNTSKQTDDKQQWTQIRTQLNDQRDAILSTEEQLRLTEARLEECIRSMNAITGAVNGIAEVLQTRVRRDIEQAVTTAVRTVEDRIAGELAASMAQMVRTAEPEIAAAWQARVSQMTAVSATGLIDLHDELQRSTSRFASVNAKVLGDLDAQVEGVVRATSQASDHLAATHSAFLSAHSAAETAAHTVAHLAVDSRRVADSLAPIDYAASNIAEQLNAMEARMPRLNERLDDATNDANLIRDYLAHGGRVASDASLLLLQFSHIPGWRQWLIRLLLGG
jgi:chromosome segregation ATPase